MRDRQRENRSANQFFDLEAECSDDDGDEDSMEEGEDEDGTDSEGEEDSGEEEGQEVADDGDSSVSMEEFHQREVEYSQWEKGSETGSEKSAVGSDLGEADLIVEEDMEEDTGERLPSPDHRASKSHASDPESMASDGISCQEETLADEDTSDLEQDIEAELDTLSDQLRQSSVSDHNDGYHSSDKSIALPPSEKVYGESDCQAPLTSGFPGD